MGICLSLFFNLQDGQFLRTVEQGGGSVRVFFARRFSNSTREATIISKANVRSSAWAVFICRRSTPQTPLRTLCQHSIAQRNADQRTRRRAILRVFTGQGGQQKPLNGLDSSGGSHLLGQHRIELERGPAFLQSHRRRLDLDFQPTKFQPGHPGRLLFAARHIHSHGAPQGSRPERLPELLTVG